MRVVLVGLPEDGARNAQETLHRVFRHALEVHDLRDEVEIEDPPPGLVLGTRRASWSDRRARVRFVRDLITQLLQGGVVVVHFDADVPWSERPSPSVERFGQVRSGVERGLEAADRGGLAGHLVAMVPYTMLESWAFRDLERSLAWSEGHPLHQQAGQDPGVLEETPHVKDRSPLGNRCNLELFNRRWPAADAYADGRSFKAFVDALERAVVSAS